MGTCLSILLGCRRRRYRRLTASVVVELDECESKGVYFFKDMPKVTKVPNIQVTSDAPSFEPLARIHRFSGLIEDRVLKATNVAPCKPNWRVMHAIDNIDFKICRWKQARCAYVFWY